MSRRSARPLMLIAVIALAITAVPASASARTSRSGSLARDVSWPQCGQPLPFGSRFAVLGANDGLAFSRNPCLVRQLAWAKQLPGAPAFYANTGNPEPSRTRHWPLGRTYPRFCSAANPDSVGCSFDYGWHAAKQSFAVAVDAAQALHHVSRANAWQRVANVTWWLDVETMNSWRTLHATPATMGAARQQDTAALLGAVDALWDEGVQEVGIYSTAMQWRIITGGAAYAKNWFASNPVWLAGFDNLADAQRGCHRSSFTGGPVAMTQFLFRGLDADVVCR